MGASGPWSKYKDPNEGMFGQTLDKGPESLAPEDEIRNEPGLIDVSVPDAMALQGAKDIAGLGVKGIAKGVGKLSEMIPATENLIPTIRRVANNQTLKSFGGTMGQLGQMAKGRGGRKVLDDAAELARDEGLADVFSTGIGREKKLDALKDATGKAIGEFRMEAGAAEPGIIDEIVQSPKIDKFLGEGSASRHIGGVDKALADIKEIGGANPTHKSLADAATFINKEAAGNKLYQPVTAETDVANLLSRKNDANMVQKMGSEKGKKYVEDLAKRTKLDPLEHLAERGELREAGGRSGLIHGIIQDVADSFGYRLSAKAAAAIHDALVGKGLMNVPQTATSGALKMAPAMTAQNMAHGGIVDRDAAIRDHILKERGQTC